MERSVLHLCDSHAHLTSSSLFAEVDAVIMRAQAADVKTIVNICTNAESMIHGLKLVQRYPWIHNVAGVHPHDAEAEGAEWFPLVQQYARSGNIVAIGETGLDYHYDHSKREIQQDYLRRHLQLALECHLPVVIHCREAFADFFKILDEKYTDVTGVLHCFTGTLAEAEVGLKRGWYISLSGVVTFKKSTELREVAKMIPMDRLLIETDAPYLAPQSHRGKPNEPAFVTETAAVIAAVKGLSLSELAHVTTQNAARLFSL